jgi:hypothetical protein
VFERARCRLPYPSVWSGAGLSTGLCKSASPLDLAMSTLNDHLASGRFLQIVRTGPGNSRAGARASRATCAARSELSRCPRSLSGSSFPAFQPRSTRLRGDSARGIKRGDCLVPANASQHPTEPHYRTWCFRRSELVLAGQTPPITALSHTAPETYQDHDRADGVSDGGDG